MPQLRFTDMYIRNLKTKESEYQVREKAERREESGFGIRIFPNGAKHWIFVYRSHGKRRIMTLGHYPELSLADARTEFQKVRVQVRKEKQDPISIRQIEKDIQKNMHEEQQNAPSIHFLVQEYINRHAKLFKRSWKEDQRILFHDIIPAWGGRKAGDIKKRDIKQLLDQIVSRGAPVMANNTFKIIRKMFNWAVKNDYLDVSPALGVDLPSPKIDRKRVLSEKEIRTVWKSLECANITPEIRKALKLILITGQRPNEVIGMRSDEIEGRWWTIPVSRQKVAKKKESDRHPHRVYLTDLAVKLIADISIIDEKTCLKETREYIFPCPHKDKAKSINRHALSRAILNNCPKDCTYDCAYCENIECKLVQSSITEKNKLGVAHFTPHDLRRTAATILAKLGTSDEVIDAILNHTKAGVVRVYNQYKYDKEKKSSLIKLSKKITEITKDNK